MRKLIIFLFLILALFLTSCSSFSVNENKEVNDGADGISVEEPTNSSLDDYKNNISSESENSYVKTSSESFVKTASENTLSSNDNQTNKSSISSFNEDYENITYIANSNTKKFHKSGCTYSEKIKSSNRIDTNSRSELINNGYSPCKRCNP